MLPPNIKETRVNRNKASFSTSERQRDSLLSRWVAAGALAATVLVAAPASAADPTPITVRLQNYTGGIAYMPDLAERLGYFTANGLKVETTIIQTGPQATQALASRSVDIALLSPFNVAPLLKARQDWRVVIGQLPNYVAIMTTKSLDKTTWPESLAQIKGKKMGVLALGGSDQTLCQRALKAAGVGPDDLTFVATATIQGTAAALQQGNVDAVCGNLLVKSLLSAHGATVAFSFFEPNQAPETYPDTVRALFGLPYFQAWTTADFAARNPEAVRRYQRAIAQTHAYVKNPANFDKLVAMMRSDAKFNVAVMNDAQFREFMRQSLAVQSITFTDAQVATWNSIVKDSLAIDMPAAKWTLATVPVSDRDAEALASK